MLSDVQVKKITVPIEIFRKLDPDTKMSALILKRQGKLVISGAPQGVSQNV